MEWTESAAQRLVYEKANAAMDPEDGHWADSRIRDLTTAKHAGLVGVVLNGTAYFLCLVALDLWVQFGVLLRFQCGVAEERASYVVLVMMLMMTITYYLCDLYLFRLYFEDILSTHIYCSICMAAMVWRHVVGDRYHEADGAYSSLVIAEIIGFSVVTTVAMWKAIKMCKVRGRHRRWAAMEQSCNIDDDYKRVVD